MPSSCFLLPTYLVEDAVGEAEDLIRSVLAELDSPSMADSTCTAAHLQEKTKSCLDAIDNSTAKFSLYSNDPSCKSIHMLLPTIVAMANLWQL